MVKAVQSPLPLPSYKHEIPVPEALLKKAHNFGVGKGAIYAAFQRGLRVPQDLVILGIGDLKGSKEMVPAFTTIHFPAEEIGGLAGREMCGLIAQSEGLKPWGSWCAGNVRSGWQSAQPVCQFGARAALICETYCKIKRDFTKKPWAPLPMRDHCAKLVWKPK